MTADSLKKRPSPLLTAIGVAGFSVAAIGDAVSGDWVRAAVWALVGSLLIGLYFPRIAALAERRWVRMLAWALAVMVFLAAFWTLAVALRAGRA